MDQDSSDTWPTQLDNTGNGPVLTPGLNGVPLEWLPDNCYATFADGFNQKRLTAREVAMLGVMNALTDKPDWHRKVMDDAIVAKWRDEALAMPLISEKTWDWILTELRDKAALFEETGRILVLDAGSRVCKSDSMVSTKLQEELKAAVQPLLDAPEKDWHPGSNDQVLNLVHPSLFPLVYGRSDVLVDGGQVSLDNVFASNGKGTAHPRPGKPDQAELDNDTSQNAAWSHRFQWLPAEVEFTSEKGSDVKITSYINNLHPRHKKLYEIVQELVSLSIGPWNDVLVDAGQPGMEEYKPRDPLRMVVYDAVHEPPWPEWLENPYHEPHLWEARRTSEYQAYRAKVVEYLDLPADVQKKADQWVADRMDNDDAFGGQESDDSGDYDAEPALDYRWETMYGLTRAAKMKHDSLRSVKHPEPGEALSYDDWKAGKPPKPKAPGTIWEHLEFPHEYYDVHIEDTFRTQGLQVIVKLASIELTPEKPTYAGGSWHVEGMANEHIVATALYYYDVDNVTQSHLQFRAEAILEDENLSYEQDEHEPLAEVFGVESRRLRHEPAVQELGAVSTPGGRLLVFPNTLQHRVAPFELADKTRPGHRRFVVLWLVDPHYRLCSTRNVPPQRHDWWAEKGLDMVKLGPLPAELEDMVRKEVGEWPMGMAEAKELRLELMKERTASAEKHDFQEYNFCEH